MFDWFELLVLAKTLAPFDSEAKIRTAINRAYYAAFNQAKRRIPNIAQPKIRSLESHNDVWDIYMRGKTRAAKAIFSHSKRLKDLRVSADYKDDAPQIEDAEQAIEYCEKIIDSLSRLKDTDF